MEKGAREDKCGERGPAAATRDPFFHSSVNIAEWMKEKVEKAIADRGHTPVQVEVAAEVMTRMSKVTVVNTVNAQFKDKKGVLYTLSDYSSINKEYDGSKNTRWLVDALKEIEMEAILKFGGKALKTQVEEGYEPKCVSVENVRVKTTDSFRVSCLFPVRLQELCKFLTEENFILRWTLGRASLKDGFYRFDGVEFGDIRAADSVITMKYRRSEWNETSTVRIHLEQIGDNVKLSLVQEGAPADAVGMLECWWREKVFMVIGHMFGCPPRFS